MKVVIIGNHAAGLTASEILRKGDKACDIVVISSEDTPPYSRCLIGDIISGKRGLEDILFKPKDFYDKYSIKTIFGREVKKVLPDEKKILIDTDERVAYDNLIIATGGSSTLPEIEGVNQKGVFCLRTIEDAKKIKEYSKNVERVVILGGGLIGIKAALAVHDCGKKVRVLVSSSSILSQIVGSEESEIFEKYLGSLGIEICTNTSPLKILGNGKVNGVETGDGQKIDCQMVIVGKGVKPNINLVKGTGIKTDYGIIVDEHCRTNIDSVYAAGDVTQSKDSLRGQNQANALWPLAVEEGRVAAENILGKDIKLRERTSMNSLAIYDLPLISCGLTGVREKIEGAEKIIIENKSKREYKKFLIKDNFLVGYSLIGNVSNAGVLTALIRKAVDIKKAKNKILAGKYDFSSVLPVIMENREKFTEPEFKEVVGFFKK
jgi:nitrite reductase (NADH) large subunit